jgi:hypothetical protein
MMLNGAKQDTPRKPERRTDCILLIKNNLLVEAAGAVSDTRIENKQVADF